MEGYIKTFVDSKAYGFIKGNDNKDYFFHINDVNNKDEGIQDNKIVVFEAKATKKGYAAVNISIQKANIQDEFKYIIPNEVYISKDINVKGWETIEDCSYILIGTSKESPDDAKKDIIDSAEAIGANALINFVYFKTTGSKPGTGSGTYYFTIHNYRANPIVIAKKSPRGKLTEEDVKTDLYFRAISFYEEAIRKTRISTWKMIIIWSIIIPLIYVLNTYDYFKNIGINEFYLGIGAIIIGFLFGRRINYSYWIKKEF